MSRCLLLQASYLYFEDGFQLRLQARDDTSFPDVVPPHKHAVSHIHWFSPSTVSAPLESTVVDETRTQTAHLMVDYPVDLEKSSNFDDYWDLMRAVGVPYCCLVLWGFSVSVDFHI